LKKIADIAVNKAIENAENLLHKEENLSPAVKSAMELILVLVKILLERLNLNSNNSSKPPSSDKTRARGTKNQKGLKKKGGQLGHQGARLNKFDSPDKVELINIDKRTLPKGQYTHVGYESRQVVDIKTSRYVIEYRAQILEDASGNRYVAEFPEDVTNDIQYGPKIKAHSVYMSQYQLLPYGRIEDYFKEQFQIPISKGSIFNFNKDAYNRLEKFEEIAKEKLVNSELIHADETGISVEKKTIWLHSASNELWTHFYPHERRGSEAMDVIGILPMFSGIMCHDHWKSYFKYECTHSLCNAHHLRELECAIENDKLQWAIDMQALLVDINDVVSGDEKSALLPSISDMYRRRYREIIEKGKLESPLPDQIDGPKKRGRPKRSKSRNLLDRLDAYEAEVLRFMDNPIVPFTNNPAENDIRMTKVQQKISGCFRSMEGAYIFCRVRSYLVTCRKQNIKMTDALELVFKGELPGFANS